MSVLRERFVATALPFMRNVYRAALRISGRSEVAEDVTQETFLRAYRTFERFEAGTDCRAWLLTIMHSVLINRYHHARRHPETPLEDLAPDSEALATADAQLTAFIDQAPAPQVEAALLSLPEEYRSVVVLVDIEELSYAEAARALECPVGTVRSRLYRARRTLAQALRDHARRAGYAVAGEQDS